MKPIRLTLIFLFVLAVAHGAVAQADRAELGRIDQEIAILEATRQRVTNEIAALERALSDPNTVVWSTGDGWRSAASAELVDQVAFLQMAAERPESRDRTEEIAGLGLPASLVEMAESRANRPAQRTVREWAESQGTADQKVLAGHLQKLKRTMKMTESWLAEHRAQRQAVLQPATRAAAYPQGPCYVPPGKWSMGSTREVLEITANDYFVTATKTRGSRQVPAGKINFYVHPRTCDAGLQNAEDGFVNPYWVRARVAVEWIEPGKQFSIAWPERQEIVYTRVD